MKLEKTPGQNQVKVGTPTINDVNWNLDRDFETFEQFEVRYPLDEITIPVCIVAPDDEGDYWLVQVALAMKNKVVDCKIWEATSSQITKYRTKALRQYKLSMGVDFNILKRTKDE